MTYKRGDVYWVQEGPTQGSEMKKTRPWILVGANPLNKARSTVIAVPLSTQVKEIPGLSVKIILNGTSSCAVLDQIRALDKSRLTRQEGSLAQYEIDLIDEGLRKVLSL